MIVVFRADSGVEIGSGHIMRCLTLAKSLQARGHSILFLSKNHPGNLLNYVGKQGFKYCALEVRENIDERSQLTHKDWVGGSQVDDAIQSITKINKEYLGLVDWVVVDHYGLDHTWENKVSEVTKKVMVVDDLADRKHACDLLLDQTFGRSNSDYLSHVSSRCELLVGSRFSLLRDEFRVNQDEILKIRERAADSPQKKYLVMMGGMDQHNLSLRVLKILIKLPYVKISVVLGSQAPHFKSVSEFAEKHGQVEVLVDCSSMAELMLNHDICVGAAGTSSWERAAMGLPTAMVAFAENQKEILKNLVCYGAVRPLEMNTLEEDLFESIKFLSYRDAYISTVKKCLSVCDGTGIKNTLKVILGE